MKCNIVLTSCNIACPTMTYLFVTPPSPSPLPSRHLQDNDPPAPRRPVTMPRGKKRKKGGEQNGDAEGGDANGAEAHAPETKRKEAKEDAQEPGDAVCDDDDGANEGEVFAPKIKRGKYTAAEAQAIVAKAVQGAIVARAIEDVARAVEDAICCYPCVTCLFAKHHARACE